MVDPCFLVLLETSGNQPYIFDTNKRRENVGASHLIASLGDWVRRELASLVPGWAPDSRVPTDTAELVTKAAGSVKVVATERGIARDLVTRVTRQALERAPGLDVCGVVVELDWQDAGGLATAVRTAHRLHAEVRAARPGPEGRFPRLPIVDQCTSSGLPARRLFRESGERGDRVPRSAPALAKLAAVDGEKGGYVRLAEAVYPGRDALEARRAIEWAVDRLGEGVDWVAVVHADGNGLGQIFTSFETYVGAPGNRAYADALRDFSDAVDRAALRAFREALGAVREVDGKVPILPLVLGGDDLTVVCDGEVGLPFAATYLRAFEAATAGLLPALPRLGAAAGVAVVKPHFPFSTAYDLAEELTDEAKVVKKEIREPASALSFHVLYDSAASSLADLRDRTTYQEGGGTVRLTAQPYIVTPVEVAWARHRRWEDLRSRVAALRATEDGERLLPRSQTHELRGGLHLGTSAADARFSLLRHRYGKRGVDRLGVDDGTGPSLFWTQGDGIRVTGLLDAMDAVDLLEDVTDADAGRARPATDGETR